MRTLLALALAALVAAPPPARADNPNHPRANRGAPPGQRGRGGHPGPPQPPPPPPQPGPGRPGAYPVVPAPAPGGTPQYRAYPGTVGVYPYYPLHPYWWMGWGWGFGYYPLYPRPRGGEYGQVEPERVATTLAVRGAGTRDGAAVGMALGVEGRRGGFDAALDALAMDSVAGSRALGSSSAAGWGTAHATWSFVSHDSARLRAEVGASMLSMPTGGTAAGAPWEGKISFGPDIGVSGQLGLVGPIGIEGHARLTPVPVPVSDLRAAVALRAGALAVTGGWRAIHVAGNGIDAPSFDFSGPEIGLALVF